MDHYKSDIQALCILFWMVFACTKAVLSVEVHSSLNKVSFLSPNYPDAHYPNNADITYRNVFRTSGPQQVRVDFELYLTSTPFCDDYVTILTDPTRLCGVESGTMYLDVQSNEFYIHFHSDGSNTDRGFNFTVTLLQGSCQPTLNFDGSYQYRLLPVTDLLSRDNLVLFLRACGIVTFAFSNDAKDPFLLSREVFLGRADNTATRIYTCNGGSTISCDIEVDVAHTDSPLDCCQFREFWFRWSDNSLDAGTGAVLGQNSFLSATFATAVPVRSFLMAGYNSGMFVAKYDANFPDNFCDTPPDLTLPDSCPNVEKTTVKDDARYAETTVAIVTDDDDVGETTSAGVETTAFFETTADALQLETVTDQAGATTLNLETSSTAADQAVTTAYQQLTRGQATPTPVVLSHKQCACRCAWQKDTQGQPKDTLDKDTLQTMEEIRRNLTVPRQNVSSEIRRYQSAGDPRPSSMYLAIFGGVVSFLPLGFIVGGDLLAMLVALRDIVKGGVGHGRQVDRKKSCSKKTIRKFVW